MKIRDLVKLFAIAGGSAVVAVGQAEPEPKLRARELFYKAPPAAQAAVPTAPKTPAKPQVKTDVKQAVVNQAATPKKKPARPSEPESASQFPLVNASTAGLAPLGLKYKLLRASAGEAFEEVDADTSYRNGDKLRLVVEANADSYLYIVAKGTSGSWEVLFPNKDIDGGDNRIRKMRDYLVPGGKAGQFSFYGAPGEEKLFLVLSRQPEKDFDSIIYKLSSGGSSEAVPVQDKEPRKPLPMQIASRIGSIDDALVGRIRNDVRARDLVFEKVDEKTPGEMKEKAVYIVNTAATADARLFVDLSLKHR